MIAYDTVLKSDFQRFPNELNQSKKTKIEFGIKYFFLAISMPPKNTQNAGKGWETSEFLGIDGTIR